MAVSAPTNTPWATLQQGCAELSTLPLTCANHLARVVYLGGDLRAELGVDIAACSAHQRLRLAAGHVRQ